MFITFEGIEGSGKSTQMARLAPVLEKEGFTVVVTREPGATRIGQKIRNILLDSSHDAMVAATELLLYQADRAQHIHEVIQPALKAHKVVLSDRFADATTVYQGYGRGLDLKWIQCLNDMVVGNLKPNLTLILDLPVQLGLKRAWKRIENQTGAVREDRFEKEALDFHEKVRRGYLTLAELEPERFRIIDASGDPDPIHEHIVEVVIHGLRAAPS